MAVQTRAAAGLCGQLGSDDDGYDDDGGGGGSGGGGGDDLFSSLAPWLVFFFAFVFLPRVSRPLIPVITSSNQLRQWGP